MSRKSAAVFVVASLAALALFLPAALGANGGGGKGKGGGGGGAASQSSTTSGCTPSAPQVLVQNSYGWNQSGSWGASRGHARLPDPDHRPRLGVRLLELRPERVRADRFLRQRPDEHAQPQAGRVCLL